MSGGSRYGVCTALMRPVTISQLIVTSEPHPNLASWVNFSMGDILPLNMYIEDGTFTISQLIVMSKPHRSYE
jgi:hypothetical protein